MAQATSMTYGGYDISPVPLVTIQRQNLQKGNRVAPLGYTFVLTLNGTITPLPSSNGGLDETDTLVEELRNAFNRDGKKLLIQCGATDVLEVYPRVKSVNFSESNNNWVQTIPYTIELEYDADDLDEHPLGTTPPYIEDYNEEWQCEFITERRYFQWDLSQVTDQRSGYDYSSNDTTNAWEARVTHVVTAKGKQTWEGPGETGSVTHAASNAMSWLTGVYAGFGYDHSNYGAGLCGWTNLVDGTGVGAYDHFRSHTVNETDGTATLTESWLVFGNNSGVSSSGRKMSEEFNIEIRESIENGLVNISINGTVQGVEERDYGSTCDLDNVVTTTAYANASGGWQEVKDRLFPRAQLLYEQEFSSRLNPNPVSKSIGHSPSRGTITYAYEFNDRPCAFITGALSENFTINDNNPSDVFASLPVLGRAAGPVLQEISTVTESTREITIEAVMHPPTGCSSITDLDLNKPEENVENLLCEFETQLTSAYDQVFKSSDSESWNPLSGRYSRTVSWTYQSCTGTPTTTLCD